MLSLPARAAEQQPVVDVAISEVWPWGYQGPDGKPHGALPLFFNSLSTAADMPLRLKLRPHRRALKELASGEADLIVAFESPVAASAGIAIAPVVKTRVLLVVRAGEVVPVALDERMTGKSVGYIRGTYYGEVFAKADGIKKVAVHDLRQAIEMLTLRRVNAVIASEHVFLHTLADMRLDAGLFSMDTIVDEQYGVLYMSKKSNLIDYIPRIRTAVEQVRSSGELDKIFSIQ